MEVEDEDNIPEWDWSEAVVDETTEMPVLPALRL